MKAVKKLIVSKPVRVDLLNKILSKVEVAASEGEFYSYYKPWFSNMRETELQALVDFGFSVYESVFGGVHIYW